MKHGGKVFRDVVDEMTIHLVEQDMDEAGEIARKKAEAEHEVGFPSFREASVITTAGIRSNEGSSHFSSQAGESSRAFQVVFFYVERVFSYTCAEGVPISQ